MVDETVKRLKKLSKSPIQVIRDTALSVLDGDDEKLEKWESVAVELNELLRGPVHYQITQVADRVASVTLDVPDRREALQLLASKFNGFVQEDNTLIVDVQRTEPVQRFMEVRLGWEAEQ